MMTLRADFILQRRPGFTCSQPNLSAFVSGGDDGKHRGCGGSRGLQGGRMERTKTERKEKRRMKMEAGPTSKQRGTHGAPSENIQRRTEEEEEEDV